MHITPLDGVTSVVIATSALLGGLYAGTGAPLTGWGALALFALAAVLVVARVTRSVCGHLERGRTRFRVMVLPRFADGGLYATDGSHRMVPLQTDCVDAADIEATRDRLIGGVPELSASTSVIGPAIVEWYGVTLVLYSVPVHAHQTSCALQRRLGLAWVCDYRAQLPNGPTAPEVRRALTRFASEFPPTTFHGTPFVRIGSDDPEYSLAPPGKHGHDPVDATVYP